MKSMECFTGACPTPQKDEELGRVRLSEGSGGVEMHQLVTKIRSLLPTTGDWQHCMDDGAALRRDDGHLVFTTDSYVVTPLFFPGGNIGKLAFCGTVNDLVVMGAEPLGMSLGLVLEEGLPKHELFSIIETIHALSQETGIPIVTGDTKVMERGKIDKLVITTSGIGHASRLLHEKLVVGDKIIVSGTIGDHGAALLSRRFDIESSLQTDSKPLITEMRLVRNIIKQAKDITRGGLAGVLHELAQRNAVALHICEHDIPLHRETSAICHVLGIDALSLACEGRLVCFASPECADTVVSLLKQCNPHAAIIGTVEEGTGVTMTTLFGRKILPRPSGNIVPRIC